MKEVAKAELKSDDIVTDQKSRQQIFMDIFNEWLLQVSKGGLYHYNCLIFKVESLGKEGFKERLMFSRENGDEPPIPVEVEVKFISEEETQEVKPDIYVKLAEDVPVDIKDALASAAHVAVGCDEVRAAFGFKGHAVPYRYTADYVRAMTKEPAEEIKNSKLNRGQ